MSEKVESIRNIALVSHGGAGKTSLAEAMLFDAGVINRMGRIAEGNTALDFEPEEIKRTSSISTGLHQVNWKKHAITLLDTPGDQNFFSDSKDLPPSRRRRRGRHRRGGRCEPVPYEQGWEFPSTSFKLPRVIFINKMDRERADSPGSWQRGEADAPPAAHHPAVADRRRGRVQRGWSISIQRRRPSSYGEDGKGQGLPKFPRT